MKMDKKQGTTIEQKVAGLIEGLPPMPGTVERLLSAAARHEGPAAEKRLVRDDPSLCFELFHMANSTCYDGLGQVETVYEAVDRVGLEPLSQSVGVRYAQHVIEENFAQMKDIRSYRDHSRDISLGCRVLALATNASGHQREMLRAVGLIHDIGRLMIMLSADRLGAPLMGTSWDKMTTVTDSEQALLGMNHCDVGARVCRKWNFSPLLAEGVLRHHTPLLDGNFSYPGAIIFLAHFATVSDFTGETLAAILPPELLGNLGLTIDRFVRAQAVCLSEMSKGRKESSRS